MASKDALAVGRTDGVGVPSAGAGAYGLYSGPDRTPAALPLGFSVLPRWDNLLVSDSE